MSKAEIEAERAALENLLIGAARVIFNATAVLTKSGATWDKAAPDKRQDAMSLVFNLVVIRHRGELQSMIKVVDPLTALAAVITDTMITSYEQELAQARPTPPNPGDEVEAKIASLLGRLPNRATNGRRNPN